MAGDPLAFLDDEIQALKDQGLYFQVRVLQSEQAPLALIDGRQVINLASNNYLGLTTHPRLREAAIQAIRDYGVGSGAVRTIIGTMTLHEELERRLADFKHTEAAIVFQSGFTANTGVIPALVGEGDVIVSDELNHASIIDGSRLTKARRVVYKHKDTDDLRQRLEETKGARRVLVVTDGIFSMDGDIAPLDKIVEVAEPYGAIVMVDDAHASGVLGANGRGTVDHYGLHGRVHVQVGTLSKAIGALGGYIAGSKALREWLVQRGRPYLFSTSHPPSVAATCLAALDVLREEPGLIERLWDNTRYFKSGLQQLGFNTGISETPITPVIVGESEKALRLSTRLFEEGVFAQAIVYPTVAQGKARVRTIVTATHRREDLDRALAAFARVGKELGAVA
ncbi:MAG: glycine C-acetyltransferase [Chloroflexi bacterium]|nr:glycine C-acetyltransferase [Chloroflexota bacterium]MCL5109512.1 glycine C-acetyltransferase [Chloroflexota bacterium]